MKKRGSGTVSVLLIGPMPPPLGGSTVLFDQLVRDLRDSCDVQVGVINTSRKETKSRASNLFHSLRVSISVLGAIRSYEVVSFHAAQRGMLLYSPVLMLICRAFGKPLVLRVFGGRLGTWLKTQSFLVQRTVRAMFDFASAILVETKSATKILSEEFSLNTYWFPNSRSLPRSGAIECQRTSARRGIFLGQVRKEKGVLSLVQATQLMRSAVEVDLYGPLLDGITSGELTTARTRYRGEISPQEVHALLVDYDFLVLPTFWPNEGYPGVIIEAFMAGIPVITTRIGGIPEIVDETTGIFVTPKSASELADAIDLMVEDSLLYRKLCSEAAKHGELFHSEKWTRTFVEICRNALGAAS